MALIGYARVSTGDQTLNLQLDALRAAGCLDIYEEHASEATAARPELASCLRACREGDTLVIWKLDRLGRNTKHLIEIADDLARRKIGLKTLTGSLNLSHFVAHKIWRKCGGSSRRCRTHRLQRRGPPRGLLVPMDPTFDLRQTARN
jgi:hypothetical protein